MRAIFGTSPYDLGAELLQLGILAEAEVDHFSGLRSESSRFGGQYEQVSVRECGSRGVGRFAGGGRGVGRINTKNVQLEMKLIKLSDAGAC